MEIGCGLQILSTQKEIFEGIMINLYQGISKFLFRCLIETQHDHISMTCLLFAEAIFDKLPKVFHI
jgi:hypothetical protein